MALSNEFRIKFHWNSKNSNLVYNLLFNDIKEVSGNCMLLGISNTNLYKQFLEDHQYEIDNLYIVDDEAMKWYVKSLEKYDVKIYFININKFIKEKSMPKFDYIIQNPPYKKSLHLDFFNKGLDLLTDTGKMVIIEPSNWLIELRQNVSSKPSSTMKKYIAIKNRIENHVKKVIIENFNNLFGIALYVPCAITYIDKEKEYKTIEYSNCGINKNVNNLNDCNLIGDIKLIKSIFEKIKKYDCEINHICHEDQNNQNIYYAKCLDILGRSFCGDPRWSDVWFNNNLYAQPCYWQSFDTRMKNPISNQIHHALKNGYHYDNPIYTDKIATNIFGTYKELDNFKFNVYNTKLIPFINICITIDQNNNSLPYIPWLVDKKYTDEEIYKLFDFTKDEIELIENTIKRYERYSPWFKRYMIGDTSIEINQKYPWLEKDA